MTSSTMLSSRTGSLMEKSNDIVKWVDPKNKQWAHHAVYYQHHGEGETKCWCCGKPIFTIWSNTLRRYKTDHEYIIHHIDFDPTNNSIDNLALVLWGCHSAIHNKAREVTQETRDRMSKSHLGKSPSRETRAKLSKALKGKPWSPARLAAQNRSREYEPID